MRQFEVVPAYFSMLNYNKIKYIVKESKKVFKDRLPLSFRSIKIDVGRFSNLPETELFIKIGPTAS